MTETLVSGAGRTGRPASVFLSPFSPEAHPFIRAAGSGVPASAAYPAVNRAFFFPFRLYRSETVYRYFWVNGTTASTDNVQVGVYDMAGNVINRGTSTLAAGVSACQFDNITDYVLGPGEYLMALWCSGTTTHILRLAPTARYLRAAGFLQQSSLTGGLPSPTATFAVSATGYVPLFGLALRASP